MEHSNPNILTLTARQSDIMAEVMKTTAYAAGKSDTGDGEYDRQSVTDEDWELLERHWQEARAVVVHALRRVVTSDTEAGGTLSIGLQLPSAWDIALGHTMQQQFASYMTMSLTAHWWAIARPSDATAAAQQAASHLEQLMRAAFYKKPPVRPAR